MNILYRDAYLVAVDKPAGVFVHRTGLSRERDVMLQRVRDHIGRRVYPVHRLDRATSGVLIFALDAEVARFLGDRFAAGEIEKTYRAVVRGYCDTRGEIDSDLVDDTGKARTALTRYALLAQTRLSIPVGRYPEARFSFLEVYPHTGRRHQIRRHLARIAHPILGDTVHGDHRQNRFQKQVLGIRRLMLHAQAINFDHPDTRQRLQIEAPPDDELARALRDLGFSTDGDRPSGLVEG